MFFPGRGPAERPSPGALRIFKPRGDPAERLSPEGTHGVFFPKGDQGKGSAVPFVGARKLVECARVRRPDGGQMGVRRGDERAQGCAGDDL